MRPGWSFPVGFGEFRVFLFTALVRRRGTCVIGVLVDSCPVIVTGGGREGGREGGEGGRRRRR